MSAVIFSAPLNLNNTLGGHGGSNALDADDWKLHCGQTMRPDRQRRMLTDGNAVRSDKIS